MLKCDKGINHGERRKSSVQVELQVKCLLLGFCFSSSDNDFLKLIFQTKKINFSNIQ